MATATATKAGKGKTTANPTDACRMTLENNGELLFYYACSCHAWRSPVYRRS